MKLYADVTKIRKDLNWQPKFLIDEGLQRTIDWYLKRWLLIR